MKIQFKFGSEIFTATLKDTPTAMKLKEALPCESKVETWGEEVYFEVPVSAALEPDATDVVEPGTVCFWSEGNALAIPFGRTPASRGDECRLVTKVNILGKIEGDAKRLAKVDAGQTAVVQTI